VSIFSWILSVVVFLGVLILVHELGHFIFAKAFGVKVLRFSLGFGPKLIGFQTSTTEYRLSLVPLGGYVRLLGEDPTEPVAEIDRHRTLFSKPLWQRYLIVIAGPTFNLLLPIFIYFFFFMGQRTLPPPIVGTVVPGMPAGNAGILPGDRVETVDGRPVRYWEQLEAKVLASPGKTLRMGIRRGSDAEERDVTPVRTPARNMFGMKEVVGYAGWGPRFQLPQVGIMDLTSPAWQAGLRTFDYVLGVNGMPVGHWSDFEREVARAGASPLRIFYLRGTHSALPFAHIEIQEPGLAVVIPQPVMDQNGRRRYETGVLPADLFVYAVKPGSPADRIGVRRGDQLLALDGQPLLHWDTLARRLDDDRDRTFQLTWLSPGGIKHEASFQQARLSRMDAYRQEEHHWVFGATPIEASKRAPDVPVKNRFFHALGHSVSHTAGIIKTVGQGLVELVRGQVPLSALAGPLTIGHAVGVAAEQGLSTYVLLMALLSINIALLNLLPIPILDGGLLMFFTIELAKGRPPSARARRIASYVGLVLVLLLMALALKNDVVRFLRPG
jgi:regulator of sigma E protease